MKSNNYSSRDIDLITWFVGRHGGNVNSFLRTELKQSKELIDAKEALDNLLLRCLPVNNTYLFRRDDWGNPDEYMLWFKKREGAIISRPEFVRFSKKEISGFNTIVETSSESRSRDIEPIIRIKEKRKADLEMEVVFQRNTNYQIVTVDIDSTMIHLKEVEINEAEELTRKKLYADSDIQKILAKKPKPNLSLTDLGLI